MPERHLHLSQVSKTYASPRGAVIALRDISFEARQAEFLTVLGPSGCGKSTLLHLLAGLDKPDRGEIAFTGWEVQPRRRLIFQDHGLFPWMTVVDNVAFGLEMQGVPFIERRQLALDHLAAMGIDGYASHYPYELSGELWAALRISILRLGLGVLLGAGTGLLLGWVMGALRPVRLLAWPFVNALHPLPKLALFPIFIVLLGIGEESKIALVALAAFFPMLVNTLAGAQQIDRLYWNVAVNYGADNWAILRRVILPGSLPMALVGRRLG